MSNWKADFQKQFDALLAEMKRLGLELQVVWMGEYGGLESITMGSSDKLVVSDPSAEIPDTAKAEVPF